MYKYKILTISQVIDSEKEFIIKNSRKKIFNIASNQILNFINKKFTLHQVGRGPFKSNTEFYKQKI